MFSRHHDGDKHIPCPPATAKNKIILPLPVKVSQLLVRLAMGYSNTVLLPNMNLMETLNGLVFQKTMYGWWKTKWLLHYRLMDLCFKSPDHAETLQIKKKKKSHEGSVWSGLCERATWLAFCLIWWNSFFSQYFVEVEIKLLDCDCTLYKLWWEMEATKTSLFTSCSL